MCSVGSKLWWNFSRHLAVSLSSRSWTNCSAGQALHLEFNPVCTVVTTSTASLTFAIFHSAYTMYLCVLCGSENKQRLFHCTALTDWLVFITETECVYCAVRSTFYFLPTQCIYVFCVDLRTNSDYFTVQHWLVGFYNWDGVFTARYVLHSTFCSHNVFMCFVWIWEQTAIISLYSINWLVFITETKCVYCAVRSTFYFLPTQCIYVFYVDLRTNSDYFTVQH